MFPQMLFPHSGRHGFDNITPDKTVPTPDKDVRSATTYAQPFSGSKKLSDTHHLHLAGRMRDAQARDPAPERSGDTEAAR